MFIIIFQEKEFKKKIKDILKNTTMEGTLTYKAEWIGFSNKMPP